MSLSVNLCEINTLKDVFQLRNEYMIIHSHSETHYESIYCTDLQLFSAVKKKKKKNLIKLNTLHST